MKEAKEKEGQNTRLFTVELSDATRKTNSNEKQHFSRVTLWHHSVTKN